MEYRADGCKYCCESCGDDYLHRDRNAEWVFGFRLRDGICLRICERHSQCFPVYRVPWRIQHADGNRGRLLYMEYRSDRVKHRGESQRHDYVRGDWIPERLLGNGLGDGICRWFGCRVGIGIAAHHLRRDVDDVGRQWRGYVCMEHGSIGSFHCGKPSEYDHVLRHRLQEWLLGIGIGNGVREPETPGDMHG